MASFKLNAAADEDEDVTFSTGEVNVNVSNGLGSLSISSPDATLVGSSSTDHTKTNTTSSSSAIDRFRESAGDKKKCPNCAKTVFKMEELLALGCIWHKDCFTCGGPTPNPGEPETLGCGRVLTIDAHDQHAGLPYCKACFQRNFMLGGARGAVLNIPERQSSGSSSSPHPPLESGGSFSHLGGGGAKCGKCNKTVYKMEEVSCIGSIWHKGCFTCGGATELGCNRTLLVPDYEQHAGTPFCKACFMRNFMKGGARGVALEGEFQTMGLSDNSALSPTTGASSSTTAYRPSTSSSSATGGGSSSTSAASSSSAGAKPAGGKFAFLGGGAKCPSCAKTVYKMEEVVASGCSWHKECFSCGKLPGGSGGKSDDGCGINMANRPFEEVKGVPYCVPCWRKAFAPKGAGLATGN